MDIVLGLEITLIGMGVVFTTLLVLMGIILLPRLFSRKTAGKKSESANGKSETISQDQIPHGHLVVIAAAVAAMGQSYQIRTIEIAGNENWQRSRFTENTV